ncbi:MAG: TonB-dependent receptor [Novosphingobium sp.]
MKFGGLKASFLAGVAIASVGYTAPALAQGAEDAGDGDAIIVTARRTEEKLQDVPISITVFTQQAISNRNVVTAADLAIYTPSLTINQRFGPEKAAFQIRGFNQDNSTAPTVGSYFADVVAPRVQGGTAGGNVPIVGSFMDLQNVQVLKGPQGTLFGRNTTGGAVLLVPTKPTDRLEGYIEGTAGNYDAWRVQAVLNAPLADNIRLRLAFDRNKREGYMINRSGIGAENFADVNYWYARGSLVWDVTPDLENYTIFHYSKSFSRNYAGRIVACNPNMGVGGDGRIVRGQINGTYGIGAGQPLGGGGALFTAQPACDQLARQEARGDGPLDVEVNNPNPYMRINQWQVINTTTWKASDNLTVKNIISYSEYRERGSFSLNSDNFRTNFGALNGLLPFAVGVPFQYIWLQPQPTGYQAAGKNFTEELQIQGQSSDGRFNYVAGGYMELGRPIGFNQGNTGILLNCVSPENQQCSQVFGTSGQISGSATQFSFDNYGLFAQGTYKFTDQLSLTAGIRYTWDKVSAFSESVRISPRTAPTPSVVTCNDVVHFFNGTPGNPLAVNDRSQCHFGPPDEKSSKPTWVIGLDYKPNADMLFYAKYSRGYRAGGLNLTTVGLEGWGPEKVDSYEIGAKLSFRGALTGYFNIAGFYNDLTDMQVQVTGVSNVAGFSGAVPEVNAGKAKIAGIEVDGSLTPFEGMKIDFGWTYLDTKLKSLVVPPIPAGAPYAAFIPTALVGGPLAQSPKNRLTLSGTYTFPLRDDLGKLSVGVTYIHTDKQIISQATLGPDFYREVNLSRAPASSSGGRGCSCGFDPILASFINGPADFRNLPATDIVNMNVNWEDFLGQPVDVSFFVTNLTNKIYPIAIGQSWNSAGFENQLMGQPRMWGFRLKYRFGN